MRVTRMRVMRVLVGAKVVVLVCLRTGHQFALDGHVSNPKVMSQALSNGLQHCGSHCLRGMHNMDRQADLAICESLGMKVVITLHRGHRQQRIVYMSDVDFFRHTVKKDVKARFQ